MTLSRKANLFDVVRFVGIGYDVLQELRGEEYRQAAIPKKGGGTRIVYQPPYYLQLVQDRLRLWLTELLPIHNAAHAVAKRSTTTNAAVHAGAKSMYKCDIQDFFPSVTHEHVAATLESFFDELSTDMVADLLTTELQPGGGRRLPQGAPSSPLLANAVCLGMDRQLAATARGWAYTRYMDDLTFSSPHTYRCLSGKLSARDVLEKTVTNIVGLHGFTLNPLKSHSYGWRDAKEVTGVVVGPSPRGGVARAPRALWRLARAMVHWYVTRRSKGKTEVQGLLAYLAQTDYERAQVYREELGDA